MSNRITRRSGPTFRRGWRQVIAIMTAACFMLEPSLPVVAGTAPAKTVEAEVKSGPEISLNEAITMALVYSDRVKKATRRSIAPRSSGSRPQKTWTLSLYSLPVMLIWRWGGPIS